MLFFMRLISQRGCSLIINKQISSDVKTNNLVNAKDITDLVY